MPKQKFSIEEIARYPSPGNIAPNAFAFNPDNTLLTFLYSPERTLTRQLWALDLKNGDQRPFTAPPGSGTTEENVSLAEALRRERQRQLTTGITHYEWAQQGQCVLIPLSDGLYVQEGLNAPLKQILATEESPALDPHF